MYSKYALLYTNTAVSDRLRILGCFLRVQVERSVLIYPLNSLKDVSYFMFLQNQTADRHFLCCTGVNVQALN